MRATATGSGTRSAPTKSFRWADDTLLTDVALFDKHAPSNCVGDQSGDWSPHRAMAPHAASEKREHRCVTGRLLRCRFVAIVFLLAASVLLLLVMSEMQLVTRAVARTTRVLKSPTENPGILAFAHLERSVESFHFARMSDPAKKKLGAAAAAAAEAAASIELLHLPPANSIRSSVGLRRNVVGGLPARGPVKAFAGGLGQTFVGKAVKDLRVAFAEAALDHSCYIQVDTPDGPMRKRAADPDRLIVNADGGEEGSTVTRVWGYFEE
jgi:hypothetical protein